MLETITHLIYVSVSIISIIGASLVVSRFVDENSSVLEYFVHICIAIILYVFGIYFTLYNIAELIKPHL